MKPDGQAWSRDQEGRALRTLTSVSLFDVSPVVFPAYADTSVAVRAMQEWTRRSPPSPSRLGAAATRTGVDHLSHIRRLQEGRLHIKAHPRPAGALVGFFMCAGAKTNKE